MYAPFLFIICASLAFIFDCGIFFCYHNQFLYLVLCVYIFELLTAPHKRTLVFLGALMCLESFVFHSTVWAPLIYLLPLTALEQKVRHNFYQSGGYTLGVGAAFILAQILVIEPFFIGLPCGFTCTFLKICANILIVGILSLKSIYQDKRDNRGAQF